MNSIEEIEEDIGLIVEEYLENNLKKYSSPEFYDKMGEDIIDYVKKMYFLDSLETEISEIEDLEEYILNSIDDILSFYHIPKRQLLELDLDLDVNNNNNKNNNDENTKILRELEEINQLQPKQRTTEWYEYRHNKFSASSIWKLLSTPSQYNSLILEKCKKYTDNQYPITNHTNPRNWGLKYEKVSIMIYEDKYPTTKVKTDYGCIPHPIYSFIAASPDGINISPDCPEKYGRMVEVKNIYNRDITGIPLEEYWIQMQLQMETCGLDVCDFLETRIKEYSGEEVFYSDNSPEYKGVILFLLGKDCVYSENRFEYMPLYINLEKKHVDKWISEIREKVVDTHIVYETIYWYLDEYSCVVVERNELWFESVLPVFQEAWNIVLSERKHGHKHREPVSRISSVTTNTNTATATAASTTKKIDKFCVVKLD